MLFSRLLDLVSSQNLVFFCGEFFEAFAHPLSIHSEMRRTKEIIIQGGMTVTGKTEGEENGVYMKGNG